MNTSLAASRREMANAGNFAQKNNKLGQRLVERRQIICYESACFYEILQIQVDKLSALIKFLCEMMVSSIRKM